MNNTMKLIIVGLVVIFLGTWTYSVLFSISGKVKEQVISSHTQMKSIKTEIENEEKKYNSFKNAKSSDIHTLLLSYSKKLELEKNFQEANSIYTSLESMLKEVDVKIEKNDSDDESWIIGKMKLFQKNKLLITQKLKYPMQRISELKNLIENTSKYNNTIKTDVDFLTKNIQVVQNKLIETTKKHKNKEQAFQKELKNYSTIIEKAYSDAKSFNSEYSKSDKDYLALEAYYKSFQKNKNEYVNLSTAYIKKLPQLDTSYSKILTDMKIDYYVEVGRSSWDESSDWDSETTKTYSPVMVSPSEYEQFSKYTGEIAVMGGFLSSSISPKISSNLWNKLNIRESRSSLPGSDDSAVYWINDMPVKFYHKYTIIENGKTKETSWVSVSEDDFEKNEGNLGMEILSKPYGLFENEKITSATPAGLNYVGNSHYGQWKNDNNGNSFWHYYGMYSMFNDLTGNNRYNDRDYNNYREYRRTHSYTSGTGYYGSNKQYGTYGSRTKTSPRYSKSNYSRSMKNTSFRNIRNAGSSSRGRGPSGGGK